MRQAINIRCNILQLQCISSMSEMATASEWRGIDHLRCEFVRRPRPHRYFLNGLEITEAQAAVHLHASSWYKDKQGS